MRDLKQALRGQPQYWTEAKGAVEAGEAEQVLRVLMLAEKGAKEAKQREVIRKLRARQRVVDAVSERLDWARHGHMPALDMGRNASGGLSWTFRRTRPEDRFIYSVQLAEEPRQALHLRPATFHYDDPRGRCTKRAYRAYETEPSPAIPITTGHRTRGPHRS